MNHTLGAEELRVDVEATCLQPDDLRRAGTHAPGGGLVGTVRDTGSAATAFLGARILVAPLRACGECDTCRRGAASVCPQRIVLGEDVDGGTAGAIVASARWVTRLGGGLDFDAATAAFIAGPALLAYSVFCRAGASAGNALVVVGQGPEAAVLRQLGKARGATVVAGRGTDSIESLRERLTEAGVAARPHKILICDGDAQLAKSLELAWPGSVLCTCQRLGIVEAEALADKELTLLCLRLAHPDLLPETAALVAKGEIDVSEYLRPAPADPSERADAARTAFDAGQCLIAKP